MWKGCNRLHRTTSDPTSSKTSAAPSATTEGGVSQVRRNKYLFPGRKHHYGNTKPGQGMPLDAWALDVDLLHAGALAPCRAEQGQE
ncbi:MAG: hypothetical protein LBB49_01500 [Gracilibacteraceae bacterium]|nr:hypothetical protein [Gracilibacteraceae bacterium]